MASPAQIANQISQASNSRTSINTLLDRSWPESSPLFTFKWICTSLPFGFDPTYVESIDLPFSNISIDEGWMGAATHTYYPSFSNISTFSLTLYEDSSMSTLQWLTYWKNQICLIYPDLTDTPSEQSQASGGYALLKNNLGAAYAKTRPAANAYFMPKWYKRNITFQLLDTANDPTLTVTLVGVWPSDTSNFSLDYSGSERLKISQTFSCDGQTLVFEKPGAVGKTGNQARVVNPGAAAAISQTVLETSTFAGPNSGQ